MDFAIYRYVVIWLGEGQQVPELSYYEEREQAEEHYRRLSMNWSGVQMAEIMHSGDLQRDQQPTPIPESDGVVRRVFNYYPREELPWRLVAVERILRALASGNWQALMQVDEMYQNTVDRIVRKLRAVGEKP